MDLLARLVVDDAERYELRRIPLLGTSVNRDAKGYISYPLEDQEDVSVVLEILGRNYDRAKAAAERRGSQDAKE